MGFEIIKTYKEHFPALRLIGKRYTDVDRPFDVKWCEWNDNKVHETLTQNAKPSDEVDNGSVGLMTFRTNHQNLPPEENGFTYWIGLLFSAGTLVPEGFDYLDLPESDVGMSWIYGSDESGEIYGSEPHTACYNKLCDNGWSKLNENAGGENLIVFFERYNDPRITTPDEKGNVILDYGFYLG